MTQRPRIAPEAAQYALPLQEPAQLDLFGFATARAMHGPKAKGRGDTYESEASKALFASQIDPYLEVFDDPWSVARFVDGAAYAEAKRVLSNWRDWPRPAMALVGPAGAGKSHFARIWAHDIGGRYESTASLNAISPERAAVMANGPLVIDDADKDCAGLQLFSVFNALARGGGPVLFVGQRPPAAWSSDSTDLSSRFSGLTSVRIDDPDDELLAQILQSICRKRFIKLDDTLARGLINRSPKSFESAFALASGVEMLAEIDALEPSVRVLERILAYASGANNIQDDINED